MRMLRRIKKEISQYKVIILGPDNAGKTTLIHNVTENLSSIAPTFGYRIHNFNHDGLDLVIHDIGGQPSIQKYWSNFYEKVEGIIFVFDMSDGRSFVELLNNVIKTKEDNIPLLIFANKSDLCEGEVVIEPINRMKIFKCSAASGENIMPGFDWLVGEIKKNELKV